MPNGRATATPPGAAVGGELTWMAPWKLLLTFFPNHRPRYASAASREHTRRPATMRGGCQLPFWPLSPPRLNVGFPAASAASPVLYSMTFTNANSSMGCAAYMKYRCRGEVGFERGMVGAGSRCGL